MIHHRESRHPANEGPWPLSRLLLHLGEMPFDISRSTESVLILGCTGSGKSSSSGAMFCRAYMRAGFGILCLCAKPLDRTMYERYGRECGREADLRVIGPGQGRLNLLDYLSRHELPGVRDTRHVVRFLETLVETSLSAQSGSGQDEAFWVMGRRQVLSNIIRILAAGDEPFSFVDVLSFLRQAPKSAREVQQGSYKATSVFGRRLAAALTNAAGTRDESAVLAARSYWLEERPQEPEKTRACLEMMISAFCDLFTDPVMHEVFCTNTTVKPEEVLEGRIIITDLSPKEYPGMGIVAQQALKVLVQEAVERRADPDDSWRRPVAMVMDEAQLYLHVSDAQFQATTRSSRCAVLAITQNLPNIITRIPGPHAEQVVNGWVGNFNTVVLHCQGELTTARWCADLLGRSRKFHVSGSVEPGPSLWKLITGAPLSSGLNVTSQEDYNVPPAAFRALRCGGEANQGEVDTYVLMNARQGHEGGKFYLPVVFLQQELLSGYENTPQKQHMGPWVPSSVTSLWALTRRFLPRWN